MDKNALEQLLKGEDPSKFYNKWIAQSSDNDKKIICYGDDMLGVMKEAKSKGYVNPVLHYVPNPKSK